MPDQVRAVVGWLQTGSVVEWTVKGDEVSLRPYQKSKKNVNWKRVWEGVRLCRSFQPTDRKQISMSEFVRLDRRMH